MEANIVGHVKELFVYPVKSMHGISVPEVSCYWYGVNGDRKYAFTRSGNMSGFPWLTARELPALLLYEPYFVDETSPSFSPIRVKTPDNRDLALDAPELVDELAARWEDKISLIRLKRGTFDCMPLSLITTNTVAKLEQASGRPLSARSFRPNILLEVVDGVTEESLVDSTLVFGDLEDAVRLNINYRTKRCVMINLDPDSAEADRRVLRSLANTSQSLAGLYAAVSQTGTIRVGDPVLLAGTR